MKPLPTLATLAFLLSPAAATPALPVTGGGSVALFSEERAPTRYANLAQALAVAAPGDVISLSDGVFTGPDNTGLVVDVPITILGRSPEVCVIDCQGAARSFRFEADVHLEGVTIRNGTAAEGGGVLVDGPPGTQARFVRVNFEDNEASSTGGGLHVLRGVLEVTDCRFVGNEADFGGGLSVGVELTTSVAATITDCAFVGNTATLSGGGMLLNGAITPDPATLVTGCHFQDNVADSGGGLATQFVERVTVDRSTFTGNHGIARGGGLAYNGNFANVQGCSLIVRNSWVVDNTSAEAAGVRSALGALVLQGSTIANNVSNGSGPGGVGWTFGAGVLVLNSILWGNVSPAPDLLDQQIVVTSGPAEAYGSDVAGIPAFGTNISSDPLFVDEAAGNYHLTPLSPCIDAGIFFGAAATQRDIDGQARLMGAGFDIGADEVPF